MRQKAKSLLHMLLGALMGLLGFSSCEAIQNIIDTPVMYGSPTVRFEAKGKVTDEAGKGIEGVRVAVRMHRYYPNSDGVIYDQNHWYNDDTLYTDAAGKYELKTSLTSFNGPDDVTIVFEDIDEDAHGGEYSSQTVTPEIKQTQKGDGSWFFGTFAVEADAKLEKK